MIVVHGIGMVDLLASKLLQFAAWRAGQIKNGPGLAHPPPRLPLRDWISLPMCGSRRGQHQLYVGTDWSGTCG